MPHFWRKEPFVFIDHFILSFSDDKYDNQFWGMAAKWMDVFIVGEKDH